MSPHRKLPLIEIGFHLFISGGSEEVGAVREVAPAGRPEIVVDIENGGEWVVPLKAVESVVEQKVILAPERLEPELREAIRHAHEAELPPALEGMQDQR